MSQLFNQTESSISIKPPPNRKIIFLFPLIIISGIIYLFYHTSGLGFKSVEKVEVINVRIGPSTIKHNTSESFQAAGWLRAEPYSIAVTSLISGVVEKIHAVEGDNVQKDQILAELNNEDALLELKKNKNKLEIAKYNLTLKQTLINIEEAKLNNHLKEIDTLKVEFQSLNNTFQKLKKGGTGIPKLEVEETEFKKKAKQAKIDQNKVLTNVLKKNVLLAKKQLELTKLNIETSQIDVERAQLNLDRTVIRTPVSGIIQNFYARVGRKQMLGSDSPISTTIAKIFQPDKLFVRVDVPLQDSFKVSINQKAKIKIDGSNHFIEGIVTHVGGEADEQKNTLSVRVKLLQSNNKIRPEMLAQVIFLEMKGNTQSTVTPSQDSLYVLESCVQNKRVAVVDFNSKIEWRNITLGNKKIDSWIHVHIGLNAGERVVVNPSVSLENNQIVKVDLKNE
jgi:HlyD family secretion protein